MAGLLKQRSHSIETTFPKRPILLQPSIYLLEWRQFQAAGPTLGVACSRNETGLFEHTHVKRNRPGRHVKRLCEFGDRRLAKGKSRKDGAASWVGES